MQERMENDFKRNEDVASEALRRLRNREKVLSGHQELIQQQEKQLDEFRARLKHEQFAREKEIQKELDAREKFFIEREKKLLERQREYEEQLMHRQNETQKFSDKLKYELASREAELDTREAKLLQAFQEINLEKEKYKEDSLKQIKTKSNDYVTSTLVTLENKESQFHLISKIWSGIGVSSLGLGLVFFAYVTIATFFVIPNPVTWPFIIFSVFKGLITVLLLAALAKYAFLFSNSYMREALKNADRRHAINFGKFYLESYGAAADWAQIKEAFEHWNISGENAFSKNEDSNIDVITLEKAASAIEKIGKSISNFGK